jgi:hypothetical protein
VRFTRRVISLISTGARRLELQNNNDELEYTQRCGERVPTADGEHGEGHI